MPKSAPVSHGSLAARVKASGQVRLTAWYIVSTSGESVAMAHGQVAGELVITCSPVARSNQALFSTPWWPGWQPVRMPVWLARVTVGIDDMAPCSKLVPMLDEAGDVGRLAGVDRVVEHVRVAAVEQEPDDVVGPRPAVVDQLGRAPRRPGGAAARPGRASPFSPTPVGVRAPRP